MASCATPRGQAAAAFNMLRKPKPQTVTAVPPLTGPSLGLTAVTMKCTYDWKALRKSSRLGGQNAAIIGEFGGGSLELPMRWRGAQAARPLS